MKAIIAIPATALLSLRAYSKNSLTPGGIFVAILSAAAHAVHPWNTPFVLLCAFFLAGSRATHINEKVKATLTLPSKGTSGGEGPRTHVQVLANSLVASFLSLLHAYTLHVRRQALVANPSASDAGSMCFSWGGDLAVVGIIANYACVAADTFSSELGILAKSEPRLITSWRLRKVPRGTNGGVTLLGLAAGLMGSMTMVTVGALFLPFCTGSTASRPGGGSAWTDTDRRSLLLGLTLWGLCGSILDSVLGALFQRSVKDVRSGKIVEGEGGVRVLVSASSAKAATLQDAKAEFKASVLGGEGKAAVEQMQKGSAISEGLDAAVPEDKYNTQDRHRRDSFGDEKPSRVVENGFDLLDNNDVNFLMAFIMSVGAMAIAGWYWDVPLKSIFPGAVGLVTKK